LGGVFCLLILGGVRLWVEGRLPTALLLARAHLISPQTIIWRASARKIIWVLRIVMPKLRRQAARLMPSTAANIFRFRAAGWRPPPAGVPEELMAIVTGVVCQVNMVTYLPGTMCFIVTDCEAFAIRWAHNLFVSLNTVLDVEVQSAHGKQRRLSLGLPRTCATDTTKGPEATRRQSQSLDATAPSTTLRDVCIKFSTPGGLARLLVLSMPGDKAAAWCRGLRKLLSMVPRLASPAHSRWALSCMAATSARGRTGFLRRSELLGLLRCANQHLSGGEINEVHRVAQSVVDEEEQLGVPQWLRPSWGGDQPKAITARHIVEVLLRSCTASQDIERLYRSFAPDGKLSLNSWLDFVRKEQLQVAASHDTSSTPSTEQSGQQAVQRLLAFAAATEQGAAELALAEEQFEQADAMCGTQHSESALSVLSFSLQLLGPHNNAVGCSRDKNVADCRDPIPWYWTPASHNSYIVGDQLTGLSSADEYRRQLLQGMRQLEIDCWDGANGPVVWHGGTLTSKEKFPEIAKAISDCAFITCTAPVVLSLEMHCTGQQQAQLAATFVEHLGEMLLRHDELSAGGRGAKISPAELTRRVLLKGKASVPGKKMMKSNSRKPSRWNDAMLRGSQQLKFQSRGSVSRLWSETLDKKRTRSVSSSADKIDPSYAACLAVRSVPLSIFVDGVASPTPLPMSSMREERYLRALKLSQAERNQMMGLGLPSNHEGEGVFGLSETQLAYRAIAQLAERPPAAAGPLQRRTASWLLRLFPEGLRFSGTNMSPIPGWLGGAQSITLNMTPPGDKTDLAMQLHFALFNGCDGYLLKPPEMLLDSEIMPALKSRDSQLESMRQGSRDDMRNSSVQHEQEGEDEEDDNDYWPPTREWLHRATVEILSLHGLPKDGEQRPQYNGSRGACHKWHPELSGPAVSPNRVAPSTPTIHISVHQIGGFCAVGKSLPLPQRTVSEVQKTVRTPNNGLNVPVGDKFHCIASEPQATFVRISVANGRKEIGFDSMVLGRLRCGFRVFQMRTLLGTRIELCYLFAQIRVGKEKNFWTTPRQVRLAHEKKVEMLEENIEELKKQNSALLLRSSVGDSPKLEKADDVSVGL